MERRRSGGEQPAPWWLHLATVVVLAASLAVALSGRGRSDAETGAALGAAQMSSSLGSVESTGEPGGLAFSPASPPATVAASTTTVASATPGLSGQPPAADSPSPGLPASSTLPPPPPTAESQEGVRRVELVGDSLLNSATVEVVDALSGAVLRIDAVPGRTIGLGRAAISDAVTNRPDIVVVALGTNDVDTPPPQLADQLAWIGQDLALVPCVVWVDAQPFRAELDTVNSQIRAMMSELGNAHMAAWSALAGPAELHADDGFHLSAAGRDAYAGLISTAIDLFCPANP